MKELILQNAIFNTNKPTNNGIPFVSTKLTSVRDFTLIYDLLSDDMKKSLNLFATKRYLTYMIKFGDEFIFWFDKNKKLWFE